MEVIRGIPGQPLGIEGAAATIGNFDGVHIGHRHIFAALRQAAGPRGRTLVVTFEPHPVKVLSPRAYFPLITTYAQRVELIAACDVDYLLIIPFTLEFAVLSAADFLARIIAGIIRPAHLVVGYDFTFGRDQKGNFALLSEHARRHGYRLTRLPARVLGGRVVSSSRVRTLVQSGEVGQAARLLGRPYAMEGKVARGVGRGRVLGFPTANLDHAQELLPAPGVYAAWARLEGERFPAAVNVGCNPTFGEASLTVEAHLLGVRADFYGARLALGFVERLRGERKFDGPEALANQIKRDVARTAELLEDERPRAAGPLPHPPPHKEKSL